MYTIAGLFNILKTISDISLSCCSCVAIIVGGIWTYNLFIQNRQKFPRAKLSYSFFKNVVSDNKVFFRVNLTITNIGQGLLSLQSIDTKIQLIEPINNALKMDFDNRGISINDNTLEISWPTVASKEVVFDKNLYEVEPGESQEFQMDFILDTEYKIINVYSHLQNVEKSNRNIGWDITTIYRLSE